jgi:ABC-2 type transport system permease protein
MNPTPNTTPNTIPDTIPGTLPDTLSASLPEAPEATQAAAPATRISELQRLYWSIRRELWENRSIYIAPLAVAGLLVLASAYGFFYAAAHGAKFSVVQTDAFQRREGFIQAYDLSAALIMGTTFLVSIFYCLDALYSERRDRSILFWKSLPLSDLTTVLSKMIVPTIILPAITFIVTIVTQTLILLLSLAAFRTSATGIAPHDLPLLQMALMLLYHLIAVHILWYAPIYAWLLLVSAWARRAPLLWATLPPAALGVLEVIALHSTHIFTLLRYRLNGNAEDDATFTLANRATAPLTHLSLTHFLTTPGLWNGLALTALFLAAAIQLRHHRNPI